MGDIYRAIRADEQYEKQVAIKLVRQGLDTEFVYARFRKERQILAGFEHENIARLLDGGTTDEGYPYFVMELVEGKLIDEYCDEYKLGVAARDSICSKRYVRPCSMPTSGWWCTGTLSPATFWSHADGVPKLLDFGIATILSPETDSPEADPTVTAQRMMTPQFASPEQLRSEVITTATDVYSLGVVLYKLLTGHLPYRLASNSPYDLAHAICDDEPAKPSTAVGGSAQIVDCDREAIKVTPERVSSCRNTSPEKLRRTLSGDLDQILLKALRKEPQRRYASAQDFANDLRSYTLGLPVSARRDTFSYRSGKFIKRNKFALALTAVFALVVLAGAVTIVREARIAERRFNDVRTLAHSLLFDIHDSIRDLPGSTAARKLLVDRALQYLDSLSHEATGTPDLQRELATAYERVGDVQGNPQFANFGDTAGAIESYRKALRIRIALADDRRSSSDDRAALAAIYVKLGFGLRVTNDLPAALELFQRAYSIAEKLATEQKNNPQSQEAFGAVCFAMARCLADMGNVRSSLEYYRKSAAIREAITGGSPAFQAHVQTMLAGVYGYMSGAMHLQGDLDTALSLQGKARDILALQVESDRQNATLEQYLLQAEYWVGYYLAEKGLPAQALPHYQVALAGYEKLTSADTHDVLARRDLGQCYVGIGKALAADGKAATGIESARKAVRILEGLAADDHFKPSYLADANSGVAYGYSRLASQPGISKTLRIASWRDARSWYQKSLDLWLLQKSKALLTKWNAAEPDRIANEIARCDAALAKLNASNP